MPDGGTFALIGVNGAGKPTVLTLVSGFMIPDTMGIFATRSQQRPNPVAVTTAAGISVDQERGIIRLTHIHAENGTSVIDISRSSFCRAGPRSGHACVVYPLTPVVRGPRFL